MNPEMLTPIGTIGWFAMLVIGPIRRGRFGELVLPLLFGMGVIDVWAVAPAQVSEDTSWKTVSAVWMAALLPYAIMVFWMVKHVLNNKRAIQ
jgi:hypothetical protein